MALTWDERAELHELLAKGIMLGRHFVRLSSVDSREEAVIHNATTGQRMKMTARDFLRQWHTIGAETPESFPEHEVMSAVGVAAPRVEMGPRGGIKPALPRNVVRFQRRG
jgi:hypothetical protein